MWLSDTIIVWHTPSVRWPQPSCKIENAEENGELIPYKVYKERVAFMAILLNAKRYLLKYFASTFWIGQNAIACYKTNWLFHWYEWLPCCSQAEETVVMRFTLVIRQPETMQLSRYIINLVQFILQPQYTLEYICEGVIQIRTSKLQ